MGSLSSGGQGTFSRTSAIISLGCSYHGLCCPSAIADIIHNWQAKGGQLPWGPLADCQAHSNEKNHP